jgi:6-phosphogluconolactonase
MRRLRLTAAIAGIAAMAGLAVAAGPAVASPSPVVGHVYINDNTAGSNGIAGFDRHANGRLTPIPGSPFATGGAGTGATVASEGAIQRAGRYLLAVDPGSNQLSVLRIHGGGKLSAVGSPVWSHGDQPVSITVHNHLVYVANAGDGGVNYTGFRLSSSGHLTHLRGSTVALPDGSQPGQVLFNATGTKVAGTRVGTSLIDSFAVRPNGRLEAAPGSPYTAQGLGPFGSEFRPTRPWQLFVSNAHDGTGNGTVSAYRVASNGTLSSIGGSPFADQQTAPCWVEISHNGRILFAVNTGTPSISSYRIGSGGALHLVGSTGFQSSAGLSPFDARLSPGGSSLWVVDNGGAISGFRVQGGHLHEFAGSPTAVPAGAVPFGIVVT